jgi:hypothetical protein
MTRFMLKLVAFVSTLLFGACGGRSPSGGTSEDSSSCDETTWYSDVDQDGYGDAQNSQEACEEPSGFIVDSDDCDDQNAAVNPGATEVCNDVDDDCEGSIDEGATDAETWFSDNDGDDYGDASASLEACDQPSGYVADNTDCEDANPLMNPGQAEVCDELDNDCDGDTDEDVTSTWYADSDFDGYGDPAVTKEACTTFSGYVADSTDCDDTDASSYPDATEVCDGADNDCDGDTDEDDAADATTWYDDVDSDGYGDAGASSVSCSAPTGTVSDSTDCDDTDEDVNPGATETCNDVDDDCDGVTDPSTSDDAEAWYLDADDDGYGDSTSSFVSCDAPVGYVEDSTDCDDGDSASYPDGTEVCDGADNDCDGSTDPDDSVDATTWYEDSDGDSYGDSSSSSVSCSTPTGKVTDATDCDDTDSSVYPGATEYCDELDNDCDGTVDEDSATDTSTWYMDADSDEYGDVSVSSMSCDPPSGYVGDATDCDDDDSDSYPAATEICWDATDNNCDSDVDEGCDEVDLSDADAKLFGEALYDQAGNAVSGAGDVNADGYDDILVGAQTEDSNGSSSGAAYLILGPIIGEYDLANSDGKFMGEADGDGAGWSVSSAGDTNADGYDDILISANAEDEGGSSAGATYLILGPTSGEFVLTDANAKLVGESSGDSSGWSVSSAGDTNADGYDDILIGAYWESEVTPGEGAAYLLNGPISGDLSLVSANARLRGEVSEDCAGLSVSGAGDTNADGYDDILVGAGYEDSGGTNAGAVYLILGPQTGDSDLSSADSKLVGEATGDFAYVVSDAGDMDNDGYGDILIGAQGEETGGTDAGATYLVRGPVTPDRTLSAVDAKLVGENADDSVGNSVSGIGDINNDGYDDIIVGAENESTNGSNAGAAYVVLGPISGSVGLADADQKLLGEDGVDHAGNSVAGAGDTNADGYNDILIGAYGESDFTGAAYLILGEGF